MAAKKQTKQPVSIEDLRAEFRKDVSDIFARNDTLGFHSEVSALIDRYMDRIVERALVKFDVAFIDKKRQLKLGELADQFFTTIKLNDNYNPEAK